MASVMRDSRPPTLMVDLDGTWARRCLCDLPNDDRHDDSCSRVESGEVRAWNDFTRVGEDHVDPAVTHVAEMHRDAGWAVVVLSGRPDSCRRQTESWLLFNDLPCTELLMRTDGDFRPDTVVKRELFVALVAPRFDVRLVLDDRDSVVAMWRGMGLVCWQVAPGAF